MNDHRTKMAPGGPIDLLAARSLVKEFVDSSSTCRWGVYQAAGTDNAIGLLARQVERSVFLEAYGQTQEEMQAEFGRFDARSVWTLIVHHDSLLPIGSVRFILGPARAQKFAHDIERYWGLSWADAVALTGWRVDDQFVDTASLSVLKEWRTSDQGWPFKISVSTQIHVAYDVDAVASTQITNPAATRALKRWGLPFLKVGSARLIDGHPFEASFIPNIRGQPWLNTNDDEFAKLVRRRDTEGRGGTRLEPIELDRESVAQAHNRYLHELDGVPHRQRGPVG